MTPSSKQLREQLAAIEHERWCDWQRWCHRILRQELPAEYLAKLNSVLDRWDRQIITRYDELSDKEKASDMEQVDRYWPLIEQHILERVAEARLNGFKAGQEDIINNYHHDPMIRREVQAATRRASNNELRGKQP